MYNLLIVDDEDGIRSTISTYFMNNGFIVDTACNGSEAIEKINEKEYDMVFMDIMMPDMDGRAACRYIREMKKVPIIFLTAIYDEESILNGYSLGADDYIVKPFSLDVLLAKTKNLVKRYRNFTDEAGVIKSQDISINTFSRKVHANGHEIQLTYKEYELLLFLIENANHVLNRDVLLDRIWGIDFFGCDRVVDNHVKKLRKKLDYAANPLTTVPSAGYMWKE